MPAHARSTENGIIVESGLVMTIVGFPDWIVCVEGIPTPLINPKTSCALKTDNKFPKIYIMSDGGGTKKKRKTIGNNNSLSVLKLNKNNVSAEMTTGKISMCISSGLCVYEPYK